MHLSHRNNAIRHNSNRMHENCKLCAVKSLDQTRKLASYQDDWKVYQGADRIEEACPFDNWTTKDAGQKTLPEASKQPTIIKYLRKNAIY